MVSYPESSQTRYLSTNRGYASDVSQTAGSAPCLRGTTLALRLKDSGPVISASVAQLPALITLLAGMHAA